MPAELIAAACGFAIGVLGTLIGVGGGFLLVPALLLVEPRWSSAVVTAFSLAVVAANALSGAASYWRAGRIDLRSLPLFALAALPGAALGVFLAHLIPRRVFDPLFGVVMIAIAAWLFLSRAEIARGMLLQRPSAQVYRDFTDRRGERYVWSFDQRLGIAGSAVIGCFSSIFGIGGGTVHVPFLVAVLGFPEHVATATSHAVLAVTATAATLIHAARGAYAADGMLVLSMSLGAVLGAPVGARLSRRVPGRVLMRILAVGLALVGIRLVVS